MPSPSPSPVLVFWGTYDLGKPRVRILLEAARELGFEVVECHASVWDGVEDKSQIRGIGPKLGRVVRLVTSFPRLWWEYARAPDHEIVLVPYPGQLDALMLLPLAKLRSAKLVWDVFMSAYDTVVLDRQLARPSSLVARGLYAWEWLVARLVSGAVLDTRAHAEYFAELFAVPRSRVGFVFVGAEDEFCGHDGTHGALDSRPPGAPRTVLFYGQFIPLQGVEVIVRAAALLQQRRDDVRFLLVGVGQESESMDRLIEEEEISIIERRQWVPYEELPVLIHGSDLALGVFGESRKASSVIPNKVFQILAVGQKLVTADTPALRELVRGDGSDGVWLVPPGDPPALADAVEAALGSDTRPPAAYRFDHRRVAAQLQVALEAIS